MNSFKKVLITGTMGTAIAFGTITPASAFSYTSSIEGPTSFAIGLNPTETRIAQTIHTGDAIDTVLGNNALGYGPLTELTNDGEPVGIIIYPIYDNPQDSLDEAVGMDRGSYFYISDLLTPDTKVTVAVENPVDQPYPQADYEDFLGEPYDEDSVN